MDKSTGTNGAELLALANEVAEIAATLRIETAVIGGYALAFHNFTRATEDFDLGSSVDVPKLSELKAELERRGYAVELRLPDDEDDLGGVIDVRRHEDDAAYVQIVNFRHPYRLPGDDHPGNAAVRRAEAFTPTLRAIRFADLIAMKLHCFARLGDSQARLDIMELLKRNPGVDLAEVDDVVKACDLTKEWKEVQESDGE